MERLSRRTFFRVASEPAVGLVVSASVVLIALADRQQNVDPAIKEVDQQIGMPSTDELKRARAVTMEPVKHTKQEVTRAVELQFTARELASTQRQLLVEKGIWDRKATGELAIAVGIAGMVVNAFRGRP